MNLLICSIYILFTYMTATANPMTGHNISPAKFHEYPFVASLGLKPSLTLPQRHHLCTGTLITKKHVLTAAHCLNYPKDQVNVIVGDLDLTTATITYNVDSWITYDDWALKRNEIPRFEINDLGIVKLSTTVYRIGIELVTITNLKAEQLHRTRAVIAGWGMTNGEKFSDVLLKAPVTIMTHEQCEHNLLLVSNLPIVVPKNLLCSSAVPYTITDCGDSGGPVLDENNVLVGVISSSCPKAQWGDFTPEFVSQYKVNVHMDISYYVDFIEDFAKN